jgi:hypothetical protein
LTVPGRCAIPTSIPDPPNEASTGSRFTARVRFVLGRFIPACAFMLAERLVSAVEETEAGVGSVVSSHIKAPFCTTLSVWTVWASVLAEVVEAGELFGAAAGEGAFAGMFSAGRGR